MTETRKQTLDREIEKIETRLEALRTLNGPRAPRASKTRKQTLGREIEKLETRLEAARTLRR